MEPVSLITIIGMIVSFVLHAIHVRNSKCHLGKQNGCFGCDAEGDISPLIDK